MVCVGMSGCVCGSVFVFVWEYVFVCVSIVTGDWLRHTEGRGSCILMSPLASAFTNSIIIFIKLEMLMKII